METDFEQIVKEAKENPNRTRQTRNSDQHSFEMNQDVRDAINNLMQTAVTNAVRTAQTSFEQNIQQMLNNHHHRQQ